MNLEKLFLDFLTREKLEGKKLILAVSGGVDSRVLLEVTSRLIVPELLAVFHLDHGSRKSSTKDFEFVQKICSEKKIRFYGGKLSKIPDSNKEAFWRQAREQAANKAKEEFGADRVLTAHHATDLAETIIFRLVKGSGMLGLSPFYLATKPFWNVPKLELEIYASKHGIEHVEDETNDDISIQRNLIRQRVLPELRKITPNLEAVFTRESVLFGELIKFVNQELQRGYSSYLEKKSIPLRKFLGLPSFLQQEFLRKVAEKTPSFSEVEDCLKWLRGSPAGNSKKEVGGVELRVEKGEVVWGYLSGGILK